MASQSNDLRKEAQDLEMRLTPGTPEFEQGRKKIELKKFESEWEDKAALDRLQLRQVTGMAAKYKEIVAEAERIAKARGFSAVLNIDDEAIAVEDKGRIIEPNDLKFQIALRTALWASPGVDITKEVLEALAK